MSKLIIREEGFAFSAAHQIVDPDLMPIDRDAAIHGHTWTVAVELLGDPDRKFDHALIEDAVISVVSQLDGVCINAIEELAYGTNEDILLKFLVPKIFAAIDQHPGVHARLLMIELGQFGAGRNGRLTTHITRWTA